MKFNKIFAAAIAATLLAGGSLAAYPQLAGDYSLTASAEEYIMGTYGDLKYVVFTDYIEISGCDKSINNVNIPTEIEGIPVTSIGASAFFNCTNLNSITIPDSITSIRKSAFYGCSSLNSITIPDSVTRIGALAFGNTPWLESKLAENPLVVVNNLIIEGKLCEGSIVIPDNVISIEDRAFHGCKGLTAITIPDSVTRIGDSAFFLCPSLTSVTIENPECDIHDSKDTMINSMNNFNGIIYGYENSTAQAYAEKYGYNFEVIGEAPEEPGYKLGDPNADGLIDAVDASYILALYAKNSTSEEAPTEYEWLTCDVNKNGLIDSVDASTVLAYYSHTSTGGTLSLEEFMKNN